MDLDFTPGQEQFRADARDWLSENVPKPPLKSMDTPEGYRQHVEWEKALHDGGWGAVAWPVEYGGRGASLVEQLIFEEEYFAANGPARVNQNGLALLAPTLMDFGTDEQKARFLPPMARGEEIWCQGWSEPDAGSDLASLRSKATRDGDDWIVSGQKTWASRGAFADWIYGLFRTDPDSERHHGLSYLLIPMDAPGVTRRPIKQLDGTTGFAEVVFDDVRVPVSQTVGDTGQGWHVAMSTAGFERSVSLRPPGRFMAPANRLVERFAADRGATPELRMRVANAWMSAEAYRLQNYWTVSKLLAGGSIGPESSLNKIFWSEMDVEIHEIAQELGGPESLLAPGAPRAIDDGRWLEAYLFALAGPIYAGTNEIQRNIVAERVLGLPRER